MAEAAPLTLRPTLAELGDWEGLVATMEERGAHLVGVARLVMPEGWVARRQGYSPDTIPLTIASPLTQRILPTEVRGAFDHHAGGLGLRLWADQSSGLGFIGIMT